MFKKIVAAAGTLLLTLGLSVVAVAAPASAAGSDSPPPYTFDTTSLTLPSGATFNTSHPNDANVKYIPLSQYVAGETWTSHGTWTITNVNIHIEGNAGFGKSMIGQQTVPFNSATSGGAFRGTLPSDGYCIVWVQVDGYNEHFGEGGQAPVCTTPPAPPATPVSVTAVPYATQPTCTTDGMLVVPGNTNVSWTGGTDGAGPGSYNLTASAASSSYTFTGQSVYPVKVLGAGAGLDCAIKPPTPPTPPTCLSPSAVSYTYSPLTNSGEITVTGPEGAVLCDDFYVTATSWKYTTNAVWPQMVDKINPIGPIAAVGTYKYGAAVECGQGDIYADWSPVPTPGPILTNPNTPYAEKFLSQMNFAGYKGNTYMNQGADCTKVLPKVDVELGTCYPNGQNPNGFSSKNLTIVFDNSKSTVPVTFSTSALDVKSVTDPSAPIVRVVAAGAIVKVETTPVWNQGGSYDVYMNGVYAVTIPSQKAVVDPFTGCVTIGTDPIASSCTVASPEDAPYTRWIKVALDNRVTYSIDGKAVTTEYTQVTVGDHKVTAVASAGYVLTPAAEKEWNFTVADTSKCAPIEPTLTGSTATGVCQKDAPYISYDVTLTDPDHTVTAKDVYLVLSDQTHSEQFLLGEIGSDGKLAGSILWPGAKVTAGVTTGWPGWVDNGSGQQVFDVTQNYGWTRALTTAVIKINPELSVTLKYPPGTTDCANPPFDPPTHPFITPTATQKQLTCTSAGSYTLGPQLGALWTVNGKSVLAGTYPVTTSQVVAISAVPDAPDYGFEDVPNPFVKSFTFTKPSDADCGKQLTTLALTGVATSGLLMLGGGILFVGFVVVFIARRRRTAE